ncbi:hypothetical protein B0H14DRAFT_2718608 [Mycena olivaceomarginata]|nr:hypothetical protein B0H14DRAFT_2718608 [Mycena olivaceomarginata]
MYIVFTLVHLPTSLLPLPHPMSAPKLVLEWIEGSASRCTLLFPHIFSLLGLRFAWPYRQPNTLASVALFTPCIRAFHATRFFRLYSPSRGDRCFLVSETVHSVGGVNTKHGLKHHRGLLLGEGE